jgi:hypothetical protein
MSDMAGKVTKVRASERGQRTSFKTPRYRGKAKVDLQSLVLRTPPRPDESHSSILRCFKDCCIRKRIGKEEKGSELTIDTDLIAAAAGSMH